MRRLLNLPNSEGASGDYPFGRIKDETTEELGTPVIEATYSDFVQSLYKFFSLSGVTPNDTEDNTTNGFQLLEAMERVFEPVGIFREQAFATIPDGWLHCKGQVYDPVAYPDLYAAIGTTFGGTPSAPLLPDRVFRSAVGSDLNVIEIGLSGGEAQHTLSLAEMPIHAHEPVDGKGYLSGYLMQLCESYEGSSQSDDGYAIRNGGGAAVLQGSTTPKGGGVAHNNMPPYLSVMVLIKAKYLGKP